MADTRTILRIRVELLGVDPPIWRRIEVAETYSFWDLHVAIQDAMGWQDSHLHHFRLIGSDLVIGMPDEDGDDTLDTRAGWEHHVRDHLNWLTPIALYEYDFGDSWLHEIRLEEAEPRVRRMAYPRCTGGSRRCPPEDCGGAHGYAELLRVIATPGDPEYNSMMEWLGGHFDPEDFAPTAVRFSDPKVRWREVFTETE